MEYMIQCHLRKPIISNKKIRSGFKHQTAWLNEKEGLKVGAIVEIKSETEGDEQGWEVVSMGTRLPAETVQERSRDYKNTRKASDV